MATIVLEQPRLLEARERFEAEGEKLVPTFGKTDRGWLSLHVPQFWEAACKYPLAERGTVTSITVYIGPENTVPNTFRLAIYSHDAANNKPGNLLVETSEFEIDHDGYWHTVEVLPTTLPPGDYWLAFKTKDAHGQYQADYADVDQITGKSFASWGPFSNPYPAPDTRHDAAVSIYATYTPTPPTPPAEVGLPEIAVASLAVADAVLVVAYLLKHFKVIE